MPARMTTDVAFIMDLLPINAALPQQWISWDSSIFCYAESCRGTLFPIRHEPGPETMGEPVELLPAPQHVRGTSRSKNIGVESGDECVGKSVNAAKQG
jgi:hypothetical protein